MPSRPALRLLILALLLAALLPPLPTAALRGWCRRDPQLMIGGEVVQLHLALGVADLQAARALSTGQPIALQLTAPDGVPVRFLGGDPGLGAGYAFQAFSSGQGLTPNQAVPLTVAAYVPLRDGSVPVQVSLLPTASGRAAHALGRGGEPDGADGRTLLLAGAATGVANSWVGFTTGPGAGPPPDYPTPPASDPGRGQAPGRHPPHP